MGALYAWSRFAIMHTGWVALMAHIAADYIAEPLALGAGGRLAVALGLVAGLTGLNLAHVRLGFGTQALLVGCVAAGFACVAGGGHPACRACGAPAPHAPAGARCRWR
jgi:hypothetical protein